MTMLCILYLFLCAVVLRTHAQSVRTNVGIVRGVTNDRATSIMYLGVPYAAVDEDDPFGPAKPHLHFEAPYDAYNDPPVCPQIINGIPQGSIHCLNLNIYTPHNAQPNSSLPVMVFVHGGGFIEGDGNFKTMSPVHLVEKDVLVVTVNYRLGPFGFLCLPELGYSNQGLKDIVLALMWIKHNINSFGGDKDNLLLFGHSAGSALVEFLLLYNEDNVFNKVILQSVNIASPYLPDEPKANEAYVRTVAEKLGVDTKDLNIKDVMKQVSILNATLLTYITKGDEFRPCIDDAFITSRTPKKINMSDKKIMIGTTSKEMLFFYKDDDASLSKFKEELDKGFYRLPVEAVDKVKKFYVTEDIKDSIVKFGTDFVFNYPLERSVRFYLDNNAIVYRYVFSYDGGQNYMKLRENIIEAGATHADELGYLFEMETHRLPVNYEDSVVQEAMIEMWTNFAKFGNPTPKLSNNIQQVWPPVERESKYYMNISDAAHSSVEEFPYRDRIEFWDAFYQLYGAQCKGFNFGEEYTRVQLRNSPFSQHSNKMRHTEFR